VSLTYDTDKRHLTDHFAAQGERFTEAQRAAVVLVQEVFAANWLRGLRNCITRWAAEYVGMFGAEARNEDGTLKGFRPEELAPWFVPFSNTGKAGRPEVRELMTRMWEEATYVREV
jgi:hypothetical protein